MMRVTLWVLFAALVLPPSALAQSSQSEEQEFAPAPAKRPELEPRRSDRCCAVGLRVGPYTPEQINPDPAGPQYSDVYGDKAQAMFALDFEWQPLRLRYVGTLGVGGSAGFYRKRGSSLRPDGTQAPEQTTFVIAPGSVDITYRMALVDDQPVVPYGGAGLDAWYFSESKEGGSGSVSGAKYGWHWRAGGMLLLDLLDPRAAGAMDVNWGVNNTYLFGEYRVINMDKFGRNTGFDLSDRTWSAGLFMEF